MTAVTSGGCLCGACRYTTEATAINVRACHCRTCQKASGAAVYARVLVPREGLLLAGPVGWYNSSDEVRRGFCTRCGSTMRSEEHTSELQSRPHLVCRLLLEKKKKKI